VVGEGGTLVVGMATTGVHFSTVLDEVKATADSEFGHEIISFLPMSENEPTIFAEFPKSTVSDFHIGRVAVVGIHNGI